MCIYIYIYTHHRIYNSFIYLSIQLFIFWWSIYDSPWIRTLSKKLLNPPKSYPKHFRKDTWIHRGYRLNQYYNIGEEDDSKNVEVCRENWWFYGNTFIVLYCGTYCPGNGKCMKTEGKQHKFPGLWFGTFLFSIHLGIMIPSDFHIFFRRGRLNHHNQFQV